MQMVCYLSYATSCQHFCCNTTHSTDTNNHHRVVTNSLACKLKFEKNISYCIENKQHLVVTQADAVLVYSYEEAKSMSIVLPTGWVNDPSGNEANLCMLS